MIARGLNACVKQKLPVASFVAPGVIGDSEQSERAGASPFARTKTKLQAFAWGFCFLCKIELIFDGLFDIINSPKIQNLTATFKMINKLGGDLYD